MSKDKTPLPRNRAELAAYYGVSFYTLKRWLAERGIDLPSRVRLSPSQVRDIIRLLGQP